VFLRENLFSFFRREKVFFFQYYKITSDLNHMKKMIKKIFTTFKNVLWELKIWRGVFAILFLAFTLPLRSLFYRKR
jgi:hypothetical protein